MLNIVALPTSDWHLTTIWSILHLSWLPFYFAININRLCSIIWVCCIWRPFNFGWWFCLGHCTWFPSCMLKSDGLETFLEKRMYVYALPLPLPPFPRSYLPHSSKFPRSASLPTLPVEQKATKQKPMLFFLPAARSIVSTAFLETH